MPKIFMASLGCAKNLVDAETMLGETLGGEFSLAVRPRDADVIVVNTCGFIEEARNEAREVIQGYLAIKKRSRGRIRVAAAGCWAEREPREILAEFPDLDAVWGLGIPSSLGEAIRRLLAGPNGVPEADGHPAGSGARPPREGTRLLSTPASYAYLRLSDGCDNRCSYCAIPLIRGGLISRDPAAILEEARTLEAGGIRELVLIGQDTTAYGRDSGSAGAGLAWLLERLLRELSVPRLRLLYAHPARLDDRVADLLLNEPRLCGYLDLPIQHISDRILALMGRGYGRERVEEILDRFAGGGPTIRTTLLLGFPGEGEGDFLEALELVKTGRFRHLGAFAYSPERGTPARDLPGRVPPEEAGRRRDAILEAQREVAFAWLDSRIGGREEILADSRLENGRWLARSVHEAPDADGNIILDGFSGRSGQFVTACIKRREGYDLLAESGGRKSGRKRNRA
ncbi:MAG: MiaB/RimO family radical SAM methylthiotransferase [Planctomycetota bacterium]|jgi:ribosomal protein S12 methylthiotransferase|nr:MiaB/RimO family radical SAM methylthiotransferase [Planctomycetota bacterium]